MSHNPILLIGYDVETKSRSKDTIKFLELAPKIHDEYGVPCTFFILGETLLYHLDEFKRVAERYSHIVDFEQHTFSHVLFKTIVVEYEGNKLVKGAPPEVVESEVRIASKTLEIVLGVKCIGLTAPWCYYRGLLDRPDLLKALWGCGIRFIRSWGRNERDSLPVSLDVQPFWYDQVVKGYPPILECCVQGWHDNALKRRLKTRDEYLEYVKSYIDKIVEKRLTWSYCQHDHSSFWKDPEMKIVEEMIEYALDNGVKIVSYKDFYVEKAKERGLRILELKN